MRHKNLKIYFYSEYNQVIDYIDSSHFSKNKKKALISGGQSPKLLYKNIKQKKIMKSYDFFLSDERLDEQNSNKKFLLKYFDRIYSNFDCSKIINPSQFSFSILSIGIDGHISSIFRTKEFKKIDECKNFIRIKKHNEYFERIGHSKNFIFQLNNIYFFIDKKKTLDLSILENKGLFLSKVLSNNKNKTIFLPTNYIKNIILDFDGVIADTLEIKGDAFQEIYRRLINDKNLLKYIKNYHLKNGGITRYDKFHFFHKKILNKMISKNEIIKLSKLFDDLVNSKLKKIKASQNFINFLKICKKKKINLFISSAASKSNIHTFLESKKISSYFNEIFDQKSKKITHIKKIKSKYDANKFNTIYVGDSNSDIEASFSCDLDIYVRKHSHNSDLIKSIKYLKVFNNFSEIKLN